MLVTSSAKAKANLIITTSYSQSRGSDPGLVAQCRIVNPRGRRRFRLWTSTRLCAGAQDARELGFLLVCTADFAVADRFGDDVKLTRTQTIMQGADRCDFRYRRVTEQD